ncbi:hypothetical protein IPV08_18265 [Methylobacterium sp. SD274]|uniref:hypothetical protein n=1 Tax=unclassified Methylobacterium TaxID=2615210 RepID=UPI001A95DAB2|nr:hypothetical protein [Methylobacterium sp. SD274]MBO1021901.1 hypothetical protein [Methylobacterium sp. SD274]
MPSHACIDPQDQYAQAEVLVTFETMADGVRLVSAHDASGDDILLGLEDRQRQALESEILDDYRHPRGSGLTTGS